MIHLYYEWEETSRTIEKVPRTVDHLQVIIHDLYTYSLVHLLIHLPHLSLLPSIFLRRGRRVTYGHSMWRVWVDTPRRLKNNKGRRWVRPDKPLMMLMRTRGWVHGVYIFFRRTRVSFWSTGRLTRKQGGGHRSPDTSPRRGTGIDGRRRSSTVRNKEEKGWGEGGREYSDPRCISRCPVPP